jgi:hypothetical protein
LSLSRRAPRQLIEDPRRRRGISTPSDELVIDTAIGGVNTLTRRRS